MALHAPARQRGVALLTVLLLVAVMTLLMAAMLEDLRFGLRRSGNGQAMTQAQWYALGSEAVARQRLQALSKRDPLRTTLDGGWNDQTIRFPLDDGAVSVRLRDRGGCFNLNSVVVGAPEQWQRSDEGARQYRALLEVLGIAPQQAHALTDALVDWIDSDTQPGAHGAEDERYLQAAVPRRTGATLLAGVSELRAIDGYTPQLIAQLQPYVCALPEGRLSPININTLRLDDAPVLVALTEGALELPAARRIIAARQAGGWRDIRMFLSQPALMEAGLSNAVLEQLELRTRYFSLYSQVDHAGAQVMLEALLQQETAGRVRLVARQWSSDQ
ncbi:type II secretion system protein K [Xanthomonas phaseoli pv. phaseoli]|uniref:Type II secretion system protein K n=1 Tax=Xanthomonas campestris pv. phaseoli TaxID=317013 RepID=A0AB38E0Y9_XANCH|nr:MULTISPECIES: type II secretion system minor pseudopilin GspK [Xanthomonas]ATS20099.1 type II secretion system minor pseudopilin GspK [Xanthomonas phaseoli pv. phaseoli]ATS26747.1 type II secretion system minor pseudopilin GspK [Xanthomonas phaseoli pv. phaseoli]ATS29781.1 type II secretion system minor pseudopilin GspK [Xanthomonas phaseoli pv. phaseoli]ATS35009.1 type II secretion system minor pseudopilin GspK [Xanthomonas phaseoli pv. phaseoli]AZU11827.1 type II secretion system protein 